MRTGDVRPCEQCGLEIAGRASQRFCSHKCQAAAWKSRNRELARDISRRSGRKRYQESPRRRAQGLAGNRKWAAKRREIIGPGGARRGYKSSMEHRVIEPLLSRGAEYEPCFLRYPAQRLLRYTPDVVLPNGIVVEVKGWFTGKDRTKLRDVRAAYPDLELRMVLATPRAYITQKREQTQSGWCEANGIRWAEQAVPDSWFTEPDHEASLAIIRAMPRIKKLPKAGSQ